MAEDGNNSASDYQRPSSSAGVIRALLEQRLAQKQQLQANGSQERERGWERETDRGCDRYAAGSFRFAMNNGTVVQIVETFNELGTRVWDTAPLMAKYFERSGEVEGRRIVELGSGTGLLGCVLAKLGARVTLTERESLQKQLQATVSANCHDELKAGTVAVCKLDWQEDLSAFASERFDMVVASDVLVFAKDIPLLVAVLTQLAPAGSDVRVVVGSPRHREGVPSFLALIGSHFDCTEVPSDQLDPKYTSNRIAVYDISAKGRGRA